VVAVSVAVVTVAVCVTIALIRKKSKGGAVDFKKQKPFAAGDVVAYLLIALLVVVLFSTVMPSSDKISVIKIVDIESGQTIAVCNVSSGKVSVTSSPAHTVTTSVSGNEITVTISTDVDGKTKQNTLTRVIRIAVNNLAGVPAIVYGVFGLGFFVYVLGGSVDRLFFAEALPAPTFGTPGLMWASLTLALLAVPVVIVATEEGLARIPRTVREGSLALGATKSETLWKIVLPMASPAMMTGMILAVARAAGEVAPLMLVGVVKLAPSLPLDGNYPYLHLDQKIMHLGFHIYDVGFQSPNVEAARPLVYATALLLVLVIATLNLSAVWIRNHLREKYKALDS